LVLFVAAVALACGGDDNGNGGNSAQQPTSCASPCTPGALCYQPDPSSNCNGDWYCWSDSLWHCAPPDSGGPGDATVTFDIYIPGEEGGDEEPAPAPDAMGAGETSTPADAGGG